jgi:membrane protease YdiL (CAAX protease family)
VLLCSGFPTQIAIAFVLQRFGLHLLEADGGFSPIFIFTLSLIDAFVLLGLIFMFLRAHHEPIRETLFGTRSLLREAWIGIALTPLMLLVVAVVMVALLMLAPRLHNVKTNPFEDMLHSGLDAGIFLVVVMVAGGVREEIQRGFIIRRFEQYLGGAPLGIAIWSVVFGFGHVPQGYDAAIAIALLGAFWGAMYARRRSVAASMVSHSAFNVAQVVKFLVLR